MSQSFFIEPIAGGSKGGEILPEVPPQKKNTHQLKRLNRTIKIRLFPVLSHIILLACLMKKVSRCILVYYFLLRSAVGLCFFV